MLTAFLRERLAVAVLDNFNRDALGGGEYTRQLVARGGPRTIVLKTDGYGVG